MSYDGGNSVAIVNRIIEEILNTYHYGKCDELSFCGAIVDGRRLSFWYEYLDCAYFEDVPENLNEVVPCMLKIIENFACDYEREYPYKYEFEALSDELESRGQEIIDAFEYVKWVYYTPEWEDEDRIFEYDNGMETSNVCFDGNIKSSLSEIYPHLGETTQNRGLDVRNGVLYDADYPDHFYYTVDNTSASYYFDESITEIDSETNAFNCPGEVINNMVITTNLKIFPNCLWMVKCIENFYIIDAHTKEVVFYTDLFNNASDYTCLTGLDIFNDFCEDYTSNPEGTIRNKKYNLMDITEPLIFDTVDSSTQTVDVTESLTVDTVEPSNQIISSNSLIDEMKQYKKLFDDGIITEEEFLLMKQKIISKI